MLRSLKDLQHYTVMASDGELGRVANFLFDDERWAIRYLVVEPSLFNDGRAVLISPIFFRKADWATHCFHLAMTAERVKASPGVNTDKPVSRQHERDYFRYYGYPYYWGYSGTWGMGAYPGLLLPWDAPPVDAADSPSDVHLRSAREVGRYGVEGSNGGLGGIVDLVVDDATWEIRYLVVDTSHWWFSKKVLVAPQWATRVSWAERKVYLSLSRELVKKSPAWDGLAPVNREYEAHLYDYYGRPVYWDQTDRPRETATAPLGADHRSS
jgi:hypothetical protein